MTEEYKSCRLCRRECGVNRTENGRGICRSSDEMTVARAALHMWEEPIISGKEGSGAIFFGGCSLGCIYCQNREISRGDKGKNVSIKRLAEIMIELEGQGAHNINLVTPTHFAPSIKESILIAREKGLSVPVVYNTGGYDSISTLKMLEGAVDVYLPDFKYYRAETARLYSNAENYPESAVDAIEEMLRQTGRAQIGTDGLIKRGVVVRILLLPGHVAEAKLILKRLYTRFKDEIFISLMSQYTPMQNMPRPLDRPVTKQEYRELTDYAAGLGITNAFIQNRESSDEAYIPSFDNIGV